MPTVAIEKIKRKTFVTEQTPLFPRYLFIQLSAQQHWGSIRSTRGVYKLLEFGGTPARVPEEIIATLQTYQSPKQALFDEGEAIKLGGGALKGAIGHFIKALAHPSGEQRALVLLQLLASTHTLQVRMADLTRRES